jgi:hypothetical protein
MASSGMTKWSDDIIAHHRSQGTQAKTSHTSLIELTFWHRASWAARQSYTSCAILCPKTAPIRD